MKGDEGLRVQWGRGGAVVRDLPGGGGGAGSERYSRGGAGEGEVLTRGGQGVRGIHRGVQGGRGLHKHIAEQRHHDGHMRTRHSIQASAVTSQRQLRHMNTSNKHSGPLQTCTTSEDDMCNEHKASLLLETVTQS